MAQAQTIQTGSFQRLLRSGIGVPVGVLAVLAMVILPLPPVALDILFTFNIALSLVVMMAVFYVARPLEFGVFPSVLLLATLLRLALNVASTRVVLLHGHTGTGAAGRSTTRVEATFSARRSRVASSSTLGKTPNSSGRAT